MEKNSVVLWRKSEICKTKNIVGVPKVFSLIQVGDFSYTGVVSKVSTDIT
jgi:hypothetical protein